MQIARRLERPNLSDDVAEKVRDMIVDGKLKAQRINEVHLAETLGVSRTPLREALMRLEAEGAVTSQPRIGFSVRPLTISEVEQIYPVRAILDPEALKISGVPAPKRIQHLKEQNQRLLDATDPRTIITLDDKWHLELLSECPNPTLIELIKQFILRTRRYEIALMRERHHLESTSLDHADIILALENRNLKRACLALKRNMESGMTPIIKWLQEREKK